MTSNDSKSSISQSVCCNNNNGQTYNSIYSCSDIENHSINLGSVLSANIQNPVKGLKQHDLYSMSYV